MINSDIQLKPDEVRMNPTTSCKIIRKTVYVVMALSVLGCAAIPKQDRYIYVGSLWGEPSRFSCAVHECLVDVTEREKQGFIEFRSTLSKFYGMKFGINIYQQGSNYYFISRSYTMIPSGFGELLKGWNEYEPKNKKLHGLISEHSHTFKP